MGIAGAYGAAGAYGLGAYGPGAYAMGAEYISALDTGVGTGWPYQFCCSSMPASSTSSRPPVRLLHQKKAQTGSKKSGIKKSRKSRYRRPVSLDELDVVVEAVGLGETLVSTTMSMVPEPVASVWNFPAAVASVHWSLRRKVAGQPTNFRVGMLHTNDTELAVDDSKRMMVNVEATLEPSPLHENWITSVDPTLMDGTWYTYDAVFAGVSSRRVGVLVNTEICWPDEERVVKPVVAVEGVPSTLVPSPNFTGAPTVGRGPMRVGGTRNVRSVAPGTEQVLLGAFAKVIVSWPSEPLTPFKMHLELPTS